ncbi:SCO family protein [Amycolatopsis sp. DR6-1]|uniref:SCO family protein n=2 Tax=Pseudonocardiaceae TaxID=2070 RepID=A0A7W3VWA5_9PSEU|nr:SCO family protein [Amycolatopsis dendrobii]
MNSSCCTPPGSGSATIVRPVPTVGGNFRLIDDSGTEVTEQSYFGKYLLVFFGFTRCQTVCPPALARIDRVLDKLGELGNRVQALYVTVDPERDTPDVLHAFLAARHPRITGLTGSAEEIESMKKAYHVHARRVDDPDGYRMPHSAFTFLMGPQGEYLTHFADTVDSKDIAAAAERFLAVR